MRLNQFAIRCVAAATACCAPALSCATASRRPASTPAVATTTWVRETPPAPAPPRAVSIPTPAERTLANGLRVIVVERHGTPLVTVQLTLKSGSEIDPPPLSGLADVTAELLSKGTATRAAPAIAKEIEALGGELSSNAVWDATRVEVSVLASNAEPATKVLADVVRNPAFADEEIERVRRQRLDQLSVGLSDPRTLAGWVAPRVVFGDGPYGHPAGGTVESVTRIKREDVRRLHETYFRPDNAVLVVGGDIKSDEAFALAENCFGDWLKPATPLPDTATGGPQSVAPTNPGRVVVIDLPDSGQAAVLFARRGIKRTDQDYFAGIVANALLSGFSGRLNQEIRIKRGLSYGAFSGLDARRDVGPYVAGALTKNASAPEVASLLMSELRALGTDVASSESLTPRKATLSGGFARSLETTDGVVGQVSELALHGINIAEINHYIGNVEAVTSEEVRRFASDKLGTDDAALIIVGDAKQFAGAFPSATVIPVNGLDLNASTLQKPSR